MLCKSIFFFYAVNAFKELKCPEKCLANHSNKYVILEEKFCNRALLLLFRLTDLDTELIFTEHYSRHFTHITSFETELYEVGAIIFLNLQNEEMEAQNVKLCIHSHLVISSKERIKTQNIFF